MNKTTSPSVPQWKTKWRVPVALVVLLAVGGLVGRAVYKHYRWKRFAVVEAGSLYRSGQLSGQQLESAIEKLGLRTIVCLNPEHADEEFEICRSRDVEFHLIKMPSSGEGDPEDFGRVLALITDPDRGPLLVHCQAGVARTGAAVALYRMIEQGWTAERAIEELRSFERRGRCEPALRAHIAAAYKLLK